MRNAHPSGMPIWYDPRTDQYSNYRTNDYQVNFDSLFEFQTYKILDNMLRNHGYRVNRQVPIVLRLQTEHYDLREWKCDFSIASIKKMMQPTDTLDGRLIEVKGILTREFRLELEMLSRDNPHAYNRLWLVVTRKKRGLPVQQITIPELKEILLEELTK